MKVLTTCTFEAQLLRSRQGREWIIDKKHPEKWIFQSVFAEIRRSYLENRILKESNQKEKTSEELLDVEAKAEAGKQRKRNNKQ